jgi:hypothetical protein
VSFLSGGCSSGEGLLASAIANSGSIPEVPLAPSAWTEVHVLAAVTGNADHRSQLAEVAA